MSNRIQLAKTGARFNLFKQILIIAVTGVAVLLPLVSHAESLSLVGNTAETFIEQNGARAQTVVKKAFKDTEVSIEATTQAWSGSGLRSGKYQGYIDHYSLNDKQNNFVYSQPYMTIYLHIASKSKDVSKKTSLNDVYRERVGIENRFANTDILRQERNVRWARSPEFLTNVRQLNDRRVDFIIADKFTLDEMNKLLIANNKKPMIISEVAVVKVDVSLGINVDVNNAGGLIEQFNESIQSDEIQASLNGILVSDIADESMLDATLYADIVRKW